MTYILTRVEVENTSPHFHYSKLNAHVSFICKGPVSHPGWTAALLASLSPCNLVTRDVLHYCSCILTATLVESHTLQSVGTTDNAAHNITFHFCANLSTDRLCCCRCTRNCDTSSQRQIASICDDADAVFNFFRPSSALFSVSLNFLLRFSL